MFSIGIRPLCIPQRLNLLKFVIKIAVTLFVLKTERKYKFFNNSN